MKNLLKIGTRNSKLALWQANAIAEKLQILGYETQIIPIISQGDKNLTQPLYQMGIVGVFTKDLDIALLNNQIDVAVHSLKDIPTTLPENIEISAVLERDFPEDILIRNQKSIHTNYNEMYIGSGSLRRQSFWKHHFPNAIFGNIRGNIQTRLQKMEDEKFDGVIFSLAGIKRMNWNVDFEILDFIIPAPAQGVVACTSLIDNSFVSEVLAKINHTETFLSTKIERDFLKYLGGGCSAPIGANVKKVNDNYFFRGGITSLDGKQNLSVQRNVSIEDQTIAEILANELLENGAKEIIQNL